MMIPLASKTNTWVYVEVKPNQMHCLTPFMEHHIYMALVVEGWKSGVTKIHDYVKSYIAPFPMRKFKTKSLRKHNRDDKKKNKKKKGKNKNTHDLQVQLQFQNEEQLNFRLTNIYDSRQLNQEEDNTYEKSINIY